MKKIIKRFAWFPIRVHDNNIEYPIWLQHYYMEFTLTDDWEYTSLSSNNPDGACGFVTPIKKWVLTNLFQK